MRTALCDILGIEHPIIQGGMAHISDGTFAATVSEGGGLGVIQSGFDAPEVVREQIRIARSMTERPFAVNLIMESKCVEEVTRVVIEERVPAVTVSAGNPARIIPLLVEAGIITMCLVPHARAAKKMQDLGAAVIIAEGMEGGGHIGRQTTLPMVRQIVEAVDIPVVAAGGIADGAGFVAALALGAVGVQMGTAFLVAEECPVDIHYKQLIIEADDTSTTLTGEPGKKQVRCLQNSFTRGYWELYDNGATSEELDAYCTGSISRAQAGDVERGAFSAGMISGLIKEVKPAAAIIRDVMAEADEAYAQLKRLYG
ncbi:MAG: enoyl-[acyl-carrier-protein] reductase FabK [Adlercreutzia mucosicola]|nr:enoyl-[acyl-carrier-protein] reductase FabK [Adlercreutzia mucosicola]